MSILNALRVYHYDNKIRIGKDSDGGYLIAELSNNNYDFIIGAGVGNDIGFEKALVDKYNINAIVFDGTETSGYKLTENEKYIKYVEKNIGINNIEKDTNKNITGTTNLFEYLNKNENIFLKMDIEGAEWQYFNFLSKENLNKFKQIVMEFHFPRTEKHFEILNKISETHYLIHYHANNNNQITYNIDNKIIPAVFECTYIRKDCCDKLEFNKIPLPTMLDKSNVKHKPEYYLNYFPFVIN